MTAFSEFLDRGNIDRAWRWIRSNPDATYKSYCGELYSRFALADDLLIDELQQRLQRRFYEPEHSCKILIPKKSGILRPYTILTVEDQIVYQSLVNVIAERLAPRVRVRYFRQTFGHIYGGKTSQWFYKKWADGYRAFNKAARDAFNRGLIFSASFDLTAFYDSVDHNVLCHFLANLGCETEFCDFLRTCLSMWTATDRRIYQFHGIPQGPLSSGLLSEVVLQHFDTFYGVNTNLVYLRYVDDIRLFAKSELDLRRMLVRLDLLSKDIGLFPQSSKIDIHRVTDINAELKSISNPTEASVRGSVVNQAKLADRLIALSPRLTPTVKIEDETRFRYLLAHAAPGSRLNGRMLSISKARPDLVPAIARYLKRYVTLPRRVVREIMQRISNNELYENVTATWISVLRGRIRPVEVIQLNRTIKTLWHPRFPGTELKGVVGTLLIEQGMLSSSQSRYAIRYVREWAARAQLIAALNAQHFGTVTLENVLNAALRDQNSDVSIAAAQQIAALNLSALPPYSGINIAAGKVLRQLGVLQRIPGRSCGIRWSLRRLTGRDTTLNWRTIFGPNYRQAEKLAVQMRALADTNVTAFVNAADVFNDLLLSRLYAHDPTLGTYALGRIGSILSSTRLSASYPAVHQLCNGIHDERLKSNLSHPVIRNTGRPTSRIPYRFLRTAKGLYSRAITELEHLW